MSHKPARAKTKPAPHGLRACYKARFGLCALLRPLAIWLILLTFLTQAVVPAGMMRSAEAGPALVICSDHGPISLAPEQGSPQEKSAKNTCLSATIALTTASAPALAPQPAGFVIAHYAPTQSALPQSPRDHARHPRAPPPLLS